MIIDIQAFDSLGKTPIIFIILIDSKARTMFVDNIHYIEARPKK